MNALFQREIEEVIPMVHDPEISSDLERLFNVDFTGYVDRSLRSAGFRDPDLDGLVHDILVKLLITPGGLVSRWRRDGPLSFRFKRAVKNAVTTLAERASKRRRKVQPLPDDELQEKQPQSEEELVADFRQWVGKALGPSHVAVLDARLEGRDIKKLVGADPGIPTAYSLKRIVQQIKAMAVEWAGTDPAFQEKVRRLMDAEQKTFAKRFSRGVRA
jgi:DNA-directed RNA polymerase specialized sigma24 family protein